MKNNIFKRNIINFKVALVIIILIFTSPINVNAATSHELGTWSLFTQVPYQIRGISMLSVNNGWAVGFERYAVNGAIIGSVILHWDGSSWNRMTSPTSSPLYAVKIISVNDGWAVGRYGTRLHWDGSTWEDFSCHVSNCVSLYSVDFTSANDVWAVGGEVYGNGGTIIGGIVHWDGSTWSQSDLLPQHMFSSVAAISANDIWVVGRYGSSYPYYTIQSHWNGISWSESIRNYGDYGLISIAMVSSSEGWAVKGHYISHYTGSWEFTYYDGPYNFSSIDMLSSNDGWIVGGTTGDVTGNSLILHWDGSTWAVIDNPASNLLLSVDMVSSYEGWAIGYDGIILHYTNYQYTYLPFLMK